MSTERRGQLVSLTKAIYDLKIPTPDEDPPDPFGLPAPVMIDEQWAERDRRVAIERADFECRAAERIARARRVALVANGFPERAIDWAEKADETTALIKRVAGWDHGESSVLVLSGSRGCGKTVAATWWASRRDRGIPLFVRAPTFARSSRYEGEKRDELMRAPALVLDDLGEEFMDIKGSFLVDLDELIDVFYGGRKPLIVTTNCTKDVFLKRYGERIADRLRECGSWFSVGDASLRKKGHP